MPLFTVTWTIELDADNHEDAAMQAVIIQRDYESAATVFMVACTEPGRRYTAKPVQVDLCDSVTPLVSYATLEAALRDLVSRCDGAEGVGPDGDNPIDTSRANHLLAQNDAARTHRPDVRHADAGDQ